MQIELGNLCEKKKITKKLSKIYTVYWQGKAKYIKIFIFLINIFLIHLLILLFIIFCTFSLQFYIGEEIKIIKY